MSKVFCINGPSGVGKGTLIKMLLARHPEEISFNVSQTTRKPRKGEVDGVDYNFISDEEFCMELEKGNFIENVQTFDCRYGVNKKFIDKDIQSGKICILDINPSGCDQIKKGGKIKATYIHIDAPTLGELERRLTGRNTETEEEIKKRLTQGIKDRIYLLDDGFYDHYLINDDLETCYKELENLVIPQKKLLTKCPYGTSWIELLAQQRIRDDLYPRMEIQFLQPGQSIEIDGHKKTIVKFKSSFGGYFSMNFLTEKYCIENWIKGSITEKLCDRIKKETPKTETETEQKRTVFLRINALMFQGDVETTFEIVITSEYFVV